MNIVNVGFIGLGNVGSKLASNIIKGNLFGRFTNISLSSEIKLNFFTNKRNLY